MIFFIAGKSLGYMYLDLFMDGEFFRNRVRNLLLHLKGVCSIEVQKNGTNLALLIDVLNHTSNLNTIRNY